MQVPESFFYGKSPATEPIKRREVGKTVEPGDESFRKVLSRERRQAKSQKDIAGKKQNQLEEPGHEVGAVSEEEKGEENEVKSFSLFSPPKTQTRPGNKPPLKETAMKTPLSQPSAAALSEEGSDLALISGEIPHLPEEEISLPLADEQWAENDLASTQQPTVAKEIVNQEDPGVKVIHEGKELPKVIAGAIHRQQAPDHTEQQQRLDEARQQIGGLFVEKKDKKEKSLSPFDSKTPAAKLEKEPPAFETTNQEIVQGKMVKEGQKQEFEEKIALPGSKQQTEAFEEILEQEQPQLRILPERIANPQSDKPLSSLVAKNSPPVEEKNIYFSETKEKVTNHKSEIEKPTSNEAPNKPSTKDKVRVDLRAIAAIVPEAIPGSQNNIEIAVRTETPERPILTHKLQEVVDQIIKEIYTLTDEGKNETTIILQHPPLLSGVKVVVETYKLAPNELNITFSNLTGPGKRLLDENLMSLRTALESNEHKFVVHQMVTTTLDEVPHYVADAQQSQRERGDGGHPGDGGQKEKQQQNEREERDPSKDRPRKSA